MLKTLATWYQVCISFASQLSIDAYVTKLFLADAWYSAYHFSHPTLVERIRAIETLEKQRGTANKKEQ